jgi:hypothetical protein
MLKEVVKIVMSSGDLATLQLFVWANIKIFSSFEVDASLRMLGRNSFGVRHSASVQRMEITRLNNYDRG